MLLTALMTLLKSRSFAPATQRKYAPYLEDFAQWCERSSAASLPIPTRVLAAYFRSLPQISKTHVAALDAVVVANGEKRLRERAELAEIFVAAQVYAPKRPERRFEIRSVDLESSTARLYQQRIAGFVSWCEEQGRVPSRQNLPEYLKTSRLSPASQRQYQASISTWSVLHENQQEVDKSGATTQSGTRQQSPNPPTTSRQTRRRSRRLTLKTSEQRLLYQLGRTGIAEHQRHARQLAGVEERRLKALEKAGFIQGHTGLVVDRDSKQMHAVRYYSLDRSGQAWLKRQGVGHLYRWNPQQVNHDLHLTDVYYRLSPQVRRTWLTESEVIEQLRLVGRFERGSAVDAAVFANGQAWAIEVAIGYKRVDIQKKQAFIDEVFDGRGVLIT